MEQNHSAAPVSDVVAVVLSGGTSRRMDGVDKTRARIGARASRDRVLDAAPAGRIIVVGPDEDLPAGVHAVREEPVGSGPLAALGRGATELRDLSDDTVVLLLAADLPLIRRRTLEALAEGARRDARVHALSRADRIQYLCAAWPLGLLRSRLDALRADLGDLAGGGVHRLYSLLSDGELSEHPAEGPDALDIDTPEDLERARAAAGLRIALAQLRVPEDASERDELVREAAARAAQEGARLLVLPEATLTPFGTDLAAAAREQSTDFETLLEELAARHGLVIVAGSFTPEPDGRVRNTLHARGASSDGAVRADYAKIHLYDAFGTRESDGVAPGDELVTIDVDGVRIGLATCYDVRFPEQFTQLARRGADVIVLPLAWGAGPGKVEQLQVLLRARALDSTCFLLAADQAADPSYEGRAPRGVGHSAVISPVGVVLQEMGEEPGMIVADLELDAVRQAREALPVLEHDRRPWVPRASA